MIETIIEQYNKTRIITEKQIDKLKKHGLINGIGGRNSILHRIVEGSQHFPFFKKKKYKKLYNDIQYQAYKHDLDYYIGESYIDFTMANIKLAWNVKKLFKWTRWYYRITIFLFVFFGTQIYGHQFFKQ